VLKRIVLLALLTGISGSIYLFGWSDFFVVKSATIVTADPKNEPLIEGKLRELNQEIAVGVRMARINKRAIEKNLESEDWIGEVRLSRNWLNGEVQLFVDERIPFLRVVLDNPTPSQASDSILFIDRLGRLFTLPGDLSQKYRELPLLKLASQRQSDLDQIATIYDAISSDFTVENLSISALSQFSAEIKYRITIVKESSEVTREREGSVLVNWGKSSDLDVKKRVLLELLARKSNRGAQEIDLSNPSLPIVSFARR
jgi:cell division septal protein FtsQ